MTKATKPSKPTKSTKSTKPLKEVRFISYAEACRIVGLSKQTMYALVKEQKIPHYRMAQRIVRFDPVELEEWLETRHSKTIEIKGE